VPKDDFDNARPRAHIVVDGKSRQFRDLGLLPEQVNIFVQAVTQEEVDLHFGVYERMLAEKLGAVPPIQ
jgi:hypothetical protein